MAVAVRAVSARGTNSCGVPTNVVGDVMLVEVAGNLTSAGTFPSISGFTLIGISPVNGTTGRYTAWLGKVITGSPDTGTYSITAPTGGTAAASEATSFSGVDITGTPWYLGSGAALAGSGTSANSTPGVSGTIANTGDYAIVGTSTGGVSVTLSGLPSGFTEIGNAASSIMHTIGGTVNAGATGSLSATISISTTNRTAILIALIAATTSPSASVTLAGSSSLSVSGRQNVPATITLAGSGALTVSSLAGDVSNEATLLAGFRAALADRDTTQVNVGIWGASVVEGYPAPPNLWTEAQLAAKLRARYPTTGLGSGGGFGYIGIPTLGLQGTATSPINMTGGSFNEIAGYGGHHRYWSTTAAQNAVLSFVLPGDATRVIIETLQTVGGMSTANAGRYRINGGAWVGFSNYNAAGDTTLLISIDRAWVAGDLIEVGHDPSNVVGPVNVSGFIGFDGDETKGIAVHNHGHYGYRIQDWNVARSATDPGFFARMKTYDLLILSDWGGNDGGGPGSLSAADFQTAFAELLDWVRNTVGYTGDILISALYNIEAGRTFVDPWSSYVAAMATVAPTYDAAFIDLTQFMPPTPNAIYAPDNVHGNADGSAYDRMSTLWLEKIAPAGSLPGSVTATVTLAGSSQLTVSGIEQAQAAVTLAGSSALTVAGQQTTAAAVTLAGSSALTVSGQQSIPAAVTLAGASTLTVSGTQSIPAAITLAGSSSLTLTPTLRRIAAITLAGSSVLAVVGGKKQIPVTVTLAGASTLTATGRQTIQPAVTLAGSSSLTISGRQDIPAAITMAGSSALLVDSSGSISAAVTLTGTSSLSVSGHLEQPAALVLAGAGALVVDGHAETAASVLLAGSSSLAVAGRQDVPAAVVLAGIGALSVDAQLDAPAAVLLEGASSLQFGGLIAELASIALTGSSDLAVGGQLEVPSTLTLAGLGTLMVAAMQVIASDALVLAGSSALIVGGQVHETGTAHPTRVTVRDLTRALELRELERAVTIRGLARATTIQEVP